MAITKDQWALIEKELSGYFGSVKLSLDGRELTLKKEHFSDNQLCIVVYIDGQWCAAWSNEKSEEFDPLTRRVWWEKKSRLYSHQRKAKIIKSFGKRKAKEYFPQLDKTSSYWMPFFMSFRTLKGVLSKEKTLELISIGYQSSTTITAPEGGQVEEVESETPH